jgi:hypothetical protein
MEKSIQGKATGAKRTTTPSTVPTTTRSTVPTTTRTTKDKEQEKVKEKEQVNTKPTIVVFEEKSELELLLIEFKRSRAKSRRPMTEKAMELLLKKLSAYSKQEQIAMLEEAIEKGWQSVYPPKQENRAGKNLKVMEAIANHNFT